MYGDNAQGKTNVLEAIYFCSTSRSHRGSKDKKMIRFDMPEAHLRMNLLKGSIHHKVDIHLKRNKAKGIAVDGVPIKKTADLLGICNVVFFSPEDLNIIKEGPAGRRRFIDLELSQLDKVYLNNLSNYNRIVNQRNHLLKELSFGGKKDLSDTREIWELQMVQYGERLIARRKEFVEQINGIIAKIHQRLTGGKESLKIIYEPSTGDLPFEQALNRYRERDLRMKSTTVGPHRDDIGFLIGDMDIRKYGSQGQQRTAALSLKLSEIELVKLATHDTPILLLDDVLSELDKHRQNYLLDSIHDIQTLITCTGVEDFVNHRFSINKVFHVQNGQVTKEN